MRFSQNENREQQDLYSVFPMNFQNMNVSKSVGDILYQLSGIEMDDQNSASSFIELGFDSLFLIQFSTRLKKELGIVVTFRQMLSEISSFELLINHIDATTEPKVVTNIDTTVVADDTRTSNVVQVAMATTEPANQAIEAQPFNGTDAYSRPHPAPVQTTSLSHSSDIERGAPGTMLESVISKQLEIMCNQLAILTGQPASAGSARNTLRTDSLKSAGANDIQRDNRSMPGEPRPTALVQSITPAVQSDVAVSEHLVPRKIKPQPFGAIARIQTGVIDALTDSQRDWLVRFIHRYNVRTAKSKAFTERYRHVHADPRVVSGFKPVLKELVYPIVAKRSNGCRIWDQDDNEYIDALNGFGSNYFGYADPDITQAVVDQLWQGAEIGPQNPLTGEAAKLICELTGMDRVGFCNTGSEAVMGAMRIARTVTGKDLIVIFSGSYHGVFDEVLVRATPQHRSIPAAPGITDASVQNVLVLEYGTDESISIIQDRIGEIAAVMVEPVQSRRPQFQPREFLHKLRSITETQDIPFIFDEVITGFRTAPGGAQEFFDIKADIATYGKVIGGGMPIGVVAGRKKYMDALDGGSWKFGDRSEPEESVTYFAGTFVRHPASIAACLAALTLLKKGGPSLQQGTNRLTEELAATLNCFFQETGAPIAVTYFGSLWRMEFEKTENFGDLLFYLIREKGIHIYNGFPCFFTLKHSEEDVKSIIEAIQDSVVELQSVAFIDSKKKSHAHDVVSQRLALTDYPLTRIQESIWLAAQFSIEGNLAYNEPLLLRLKGKLDLAGLRMSIEAVYRRHDALHATFSADGNFQQFPTPDPLEQVFHDFSGKDSVSRHDSLNAIIDRVSRTPLDLAHGPLFTIETIQYSEDETILVCSAHHIVCDGWSWNILLSEIGTVYSAIVCANTPPKLTDAHSFRDFVIQDVEYDRDVKDAGSLEHWIAQLSDSPLYLDLPTDRVRAPVGSFSGDTITYFIPLETYRAVKALSVKENTSLFTLLSSVFLILMSRISQQQRLVISTPVAGQMLSGQFDLVGCCIRLLPIAADVDENLAFGEFLTRMKTIVLDGFENVNVDFKELLKEQLKTHNSNRTPFAEVCFNLDRDEAGVAFHQLTANVEQARKIAVINDIFFNVNESSNGLKIDCDFNTDLFDRSTVQRWINGFEVLLEAIAQTPELPIRQLNSMSKEESKFLLQHGVAKRYPLAEVERIDQLFDQKASENPAATAVISDSDRVSYEELYQRSNRLANHLQHLGIRFGERIGIYLDRSPLALIATLATMKAGGICIPLDPSYPAERIRFMIDDAMVNLILTREKLLNEKVSENASFSNKLLALDKNWPDIQKQSVELFKREAKKPKIAFILYTSASTGNPVGVKTLHSAHMQRFAWMWRQYPFSSTDICCQKTSFCFIDSVWELFGPLLGGVPSVFIPADTLMDNYQFLAMMDSHKISRMVLVPSLLRLLVSSARKKACHLPALKYCFSSGEILAPDLARDFNLQFPHCKLVNLYGTTEISGDATFHEFESSSNKQRIDIGRPIDNTSVYLLDRYENPVPVGSSGEIYIGGEILSAEYINQPNLNSARFIARPKSTSVPEFAHLQEVRLFRTGDSGRISSDGSFEYIGRTDTQIQVNGIRIDTAEIAAVFASHDSVAECLIESRVQPFTNTENNKSEERCLVAYLRSHNNITLNVADIKSHVKKFLPLYMVPQKIFQLSNFPLTPNGKLDRMQLLQQAVTVSDNAVKTRVPRTRTEEVLLQAWSKGIGTIDINMEDNYFDLGTSFTLIKIISALQEDHGISISIQDFLRHPTLEDLAKYMAPQLKKFDEDTEVMPGIESIILLQKGDKKPPLLLIPPAGVTEIYFMPLLSKMDASIPVYSISPDAILKYDSLTLYAQHLVAEWTLLQPSGPCIVAGMCMGTHLAFEVTNQLRRNGHNVQLLAVIDHDAPEVPGSQVNYFFSKQGPMVPVSRAFQHLKAGRLGRLLLRASIAIERNFDDDLDHYMKLLEWQNGISSEYRATPCDTDILLIQSEEFAEHRDLIKQWSTLTSGSLVVETLDDVAHDEFTEDDPKPLYRVAQVLDHHIKKVFPEEWHQRRHLDSVLETQDTFRSG